MKFIKILILIIVAIGAILLVTACFVKKSYSVEKEVVINKPKQDVFNYIKLLKNQNNYSKWATMDESMRHYYNGTDGAVGFVYSWESDSDDVGKGSQKIVDIKEGEKIDMQIHFIKPFEGDADAYLATDTVSSTSTKVKWGFVGKMKYPMNVMLLFMNLDKMVGSDLQTGLNNLKGVLEK